MWSKCNSNSRKYFTTSRRVAPSPSPSISPGPEPLAKGAAAGSIFFLSFVIRPYRSKEHIKATALSY